MNWDVIVYDICLDYDHYKKYIEELRQTDFDKYKKVFSEITLDDDNTRAFNRQDLVDKLNLIKELGVKVKTVYRRAPRDMNIDVTKAYRKYILESVNESTEEKHDSEWYYNNRIESKFDKWLDYDFGGIRTYAIPFDDDRDKSYYYQETWNFVGRQPDGKYYFRCSQSADKDMIGRVLSFNRFNDVARFVALPR